MKNEMEKEEFENAIREYLMKHVGFNVMCDPDGDGRLRVHISMWLDNQKIADASDTITFQ